MGQDVKRHISQRQSERVALEGRMRLFPFVNGERVTLNGQVNDISEGGLSVYVPAEFNIDDTFDVEVTLPYSSVAILAKVVVRTRDNFRYGLQFVHLSPKQQEALARACQLLALMA